MVRFLMGVSWDRRWLLLSLMLIITALHPVRSQSTPSISDNKLLCMAEMVTNIEAR